MRRLGCRRRIGIPFNPKPPRARVSHYGSGGAGLRVELAVDLSNRSLESVVTSRPHLAGALVCRRYPAPIQDSVPTTHASTAGDLSCREPRRKAAQVMCR